MPLYNDARTPIVRPPVSMAQVGMQDPSPSNDTSLGRDREPGHDEGVPAFLQLTDKLTGRRCAILLEPGDLELTIAETVDRFLRGCPISQYVTERRMSAESGDALRAIQDDYFLLSDGGQLMGPAPGATIEQQGTTLDGSDLPRVARVVADGVPIRVIDLTIDRAGAGYSRNWSGFHKRRWDRDPERYSSFIGDAVESVHPAPDAERILANESLADSTELIRCLARRIWDADFESYSRFTDGGRRYRTGDETVNNISDGAGGICSEKVQALKFLTDSLGLESTYVLSGPDIPDPPPEAKLRELLETFDFGFAKRHMRYWQHLALLFRLDGGDLLVDATNGNIPFLFARGADASRYLDYDDKVALNVRMAVYREKFYYHRVSQDLVEDLYFAMEHFVPEIDLVQVFDNELGLYIDRSVFVTPVVYVTDDDYDTLGAQYAGICGSEDLPLEISPNWSLDSPLGRDLQERRPEVARAILESEELLLNRYDYFEGPGHRAGLATIGLQAPR